MVQAGQCSGDGTAVLSYVLDQTSSTTTSSTTTSIDTTSTTTDGGVGNQGADRGATPAYPVSGTSRYTG